MQRTKGASGKGSKEQSTEDTSLQIWCWTTIQKLQKGEGDKEKKSTIQSYQYLWDICSWCLLNRDAPLMLGGPGVVVQIDESLFWHKPKVSCTSTKE